MWTYVYIYIYEFATMVDTKNQFGFQDPISCRCSMITVRNYPSTNPMSYGKSMFPTRPRCWRLWDTPPKQSRSVGFQETLHGGLNPKKNGDLATRIDDFTNGHGGKKCIHTGRKINTGDLRNAPCFCR